MLRKMVTALALMLASPAMAQTVLAPPSVKWAGQFTVPTPVQNIGYDSGTGLPCIVGSVATCAVPTSGATGGGAVYGPTAKGSPAANPPVVMGGTADGSATGNVTVAKVDASGNVSVSAASLPLPTGAATAANQTATQAPVTAATATATSSNLIGCQYQTTPDTFTNGQQGHVACGPKGSLVVSSAIANGSPPVHSPVLTAGWDSTNTQTFLTDTSGREIVAGQTADGSPNVANPLVIAGTSDGTNSGNVAIVQVSSTGTMNVGGSVGSGASDNGFPIKTGCVYNSTLPTVTTGQRVDCQAGTRGSIHVTLLGNDASNAVNVTNQTDAFANGNIGLQTLSWGQIFNGTSEDRQRSIQGIDGTGLGVSAVEEGGASFNNITTATTTTVKSGAGTFHKLCINTYVASGTITIYNNTAASGTKIATITNPATLLAEGPNCAVFDIYFSTGLTIVTTGAQDITAIYR